MLTAVEEFLVGVVSRAGARVGRLELAVGELGLDIELLEEAVHPVLGEGIVVHRLALAHRFRLLQVLQAALVELLEVGDACIIQRRVGAPVGMACLRGAAGLDFFLGIALNERLAFVFLDARVVGIAVVLGRAVGRRVLARG